MKTDYPIIEFKDGSEFDQWLNKTNEDGVWMKIAKKDSGLKTLNYAGALEVALCYGWIDGMAKRIDDKYYLQKFTPRRKGSIWSKINVQKVERLIKEGKMKASGMKEVKAAKEDGRWDAAYAPSSHRQLNPDFEKALNNSPKAKEFYETLTKQNKFAFNFRINTVKKAETKQKKISKFIKMLENGQKFY